MCFSNGDYYDEDEDDEAEEMELIDEGTTSEEYGDSNDKSTNRLTIPLIGSSNSGSGLGV